MRVFTVCLFVVLTALSVFAETPTFPPDYPQSLERELAALLEVRSQKSEDPSFLLKLAGTYFDMGNDLLTDNEKRIMAYGEAARLAQHALELKRSEEHTSELQSPCNLVCRLLLEKKNHGIGALP